MNCVGEPSYLATQSTKATRYTMNFVATSTKACYQHHRNIISSMKKPVSCLNLFGKNKVCACYKTGYATGLENKSRTRSIRHMSRIDLFSRSNLRHFLGLLVAKPAVPVPSQQ